MVKLIPKYMYATRTSFELPSSRIPNYTFADAVEKACLPGGYPLCDCQLVNVSDPRPHTEYSPPKKNPAEYKGLYFERSLRECTSSLLPLLYTI